MKLVERSGVAILGVALLAVGCAQEPPAGDLLLEDLQDQAAECDYTIDYDKKDPNDYLWTVKAEAFSTLAVIGGDVEVNFRRYRAGVDPATGSPEDSGEVWTRNPVDLGTFRDPLFGSVETVLAEDISYRDLVSGAFSFHAVRSSDGLSMTSCHKTVSIPQAIEAHNELLEGRPSFDIPEGIGTDPREYFDYLSEQPGVVMLVDGDCDIPDQGNPTETRSVLSILVLSVEGRPNPKLVHPVRRDGINYDLLPNQATYCEDSPYDYRWAVYAHTAMTQVGNSNDFPNGNPVVLNVGGGLGGLEADNVQVDPENGELDAPRGVILTNFGGAEVRSDELPWLITLRPEELAQLDDSGYDGEVPSEEAGEEEAGEGDQPQPTEPGVFRFSIRRNDFIGDEYYASCSANITLDHLKLTATTDTLLHLVKPEHPEYDPGQPNHVPVTCDDGHLTSLGLGLHYLDISIKEAGRRPVYRPEPPRPDLSQIVAEEPLRQDLPEGVDGAGPR